MSEPAAETQPRRPKKWLLVAGISLAIGVASVTGVAGWALASSQTPASSAPSQPLSTVEVTQGPLVATKQLVGTLRFDQARALLAGLSGVVTWLPTAGSVIGEGGVLYKVNLKPAVLLRSELPAWRDFTMGMTTGPDVQQLKACLQRLGFFTGTVDDVFTSRTEAAIRAWQKSLGQPQTGSLELGSVVFLPADVRIADLKTSVGASVSAGSEIAGMSSSNKIVRLALKLEDQTLGVTGQAVKVTLPGGTSADGTVTSVGAVTENSGEGEKAASPTIPITIELADQNAAASIQQASVAVHFSGARKDNVLSVPVEALIALDDSRFGVEVMNGEGTTSKTSVTAGMFAAGRVEISGDGIAKGTKVLVPTR